MIEKYFPESKFWCVVKTSPVSAFVGAGFCMLVKCNFAAHSALSPALGGV